MGRVAQAGALAALADQEYLRATVARIAFAREAIAAVAENNGLVPLPSATNFVTIDCGRDGAFARAVLASLVAQGVFVRMPFTAPQDRCIRVSVGGPEEIAAFAAALPGALRAAAG
jgi:histidinol-phosphate aminotransferase